MKKFTKTLSLILIIFAMLSFSACKNKDYSVYLFTSTGGYITIDDSNDKILEKEVLRYNKKGELTLNAHAEQGYTFLYWEVNSYVYSKKTTLEISFKDETVIKANFKNNLEGEYQITFVNELNEKISEYKILHDEFISLPTVTVHDGYKAEFYDIEDENYVLNSNTKYQFGTDKVFKLRYVSTQTITPESYTVTVEANNKCNFELISSSYTVNSGDVFKIKITPINNYKITSVKANTNVITDSNNDNIYEITITENTTITVTTEQIYTPPVQPTHIVTFINGEGYTFDILYSGYITSSNNYVVTVVEDGLVQFKIDIEDGYSLVLVHLGDNTPVAHVGGIYTIRNITHGINIYANVVKNTKTVSFVYNSSLVSVTDEDGNAFENDCAIITSNFQFKASAININDIIIVKANNQIIDSNLGVYTISNNADTIISISCYKPIHIEYGEINNIGFGDHAGVDITSCESNIYANYDILATDSEKLVFISNINIQQWIQATSDLIPNYKIISINSILTSSPTFISDLYNTLDTSDEIALNWGLE